MFIDSHTHLFLKNFKNDIDDVIQNSIKSNVRKFLLPNIDSTTIEPMLNLVKRYPLNCFPTIGLHPCSVKENYKEELMIVEKSLLKHKYYAIGEIGIDLYWDKKYIEEQKEAFKIQLQLSEKNNLPVIIHVRNSFNEVFEVLEKIKTKNTKGVFHCFSGDYKQAQKAINMGFKLGIGGVVTYSNSKLKDFLNKIDLKNILLETDSPYLSPHPFRGTRNESKNIKVIAEKLSEIYKCDVRKIAKQTTENTINLFKI
tara:strand:- start:15 stop:779 length:765 start_codon:yes stop_codon:yes gene_type:complete